MKNIREQIYLAALLHDIGKFYQRADTGSVESSKYLNSVGKQERTFCREYNGEYINKHVLWTAQFIDDFSSVFNKLIGSNKDNPSENDNFIKLVAGHHLPKDQQSELGKIIKEADCLSLGLDSDSNKALLDAQDENDWNSFRTKRMVSILETIHKSDNDTKWRHIPVEKMSLNQSCFPKESFEKSPDYATLWNEFMVEFKSIQAKTYHAFTETLLNLLFKYTSCIPSSTINFPDISLYDHLKTTAALAVCIFDTEQSDDDQEDRFLLVGADFSGIQSYIYQIVSKYAGKNLKGRSFYLRILSDVIVRYLLKELNLFQANIIYNSGGSFYLLAPNTKEIKNKLDKCITNIEEHLFKVFGTSLHLAIDSVPVSDNALLHQNGEDLGKVWRSLFEKRDKKKLCKFVSQLEVSYENFFNPILSGGDTKHDIITGEEFLPKEKICSEGDLSPIKQISKEQIILGKKLRNFDVLVVSDGSITYWNDKDPIEPIGLGFYYYFLKNKDLKQMKDQLHSSTDKMTVITFNGKNGDCSFIGDDGLDNIYALDFYGGNEIDEDMASSFDEMCNKHYAKDAFKRLGVLRMDVDNLGHIFQSGIKPERATLSRYAALSRSLDYFFSGYLNTIWQKVYPSKSFIVYSGGDDVFIVGSWDVTIEIAKQIRNDFRDFTCNNPTFSISCGIAVVPAKFPIMKGAEISAIEESNAKNHNSSNTKKNSISFLETPLNWEKEFPFVEKLKDKIADMENDDSLSKSFISKILSHAINADIENHKITKFNTYWMLTYDLSRMRERVKNDDVKTMIDNCISDVCKKKKTLNGYDIETDYHVLELWALACRWAELDIRTNKL